MWQSPVVYFTVSPDIFILTSKQNKHVDDKVANTQKATNSLYKGSGRVGF